jgi:hypothetical protein
MPSTFCFPRARRFGAAGLLLGTALAAACGGASDAGNTAAADPTAPPTMRAASAAMMKRDSPASVCTVSVMSRVAGTSKSNRIGR